MQLGMIAQLRGDLAHAEARYKEAQALFVDDGGRQWVLRQLGYVALEGGRQQAAATFFRVSLELTWSHRKDAALMEALNAVAALAREQQQWERAAKLVGAADAGLERLGAIWPEPTCRHERERTLAAAREALGEPAFAAAYAAGRALMPAQAVAVVLAGADPACLDETAKS